MARTRNRGFTLIEVMIVAVIVGVLAAIAYPSYQQYQKRTNRAAAISYMLSVANRQQQYLLDQRSYAGSGTAQSADSLGLGAAPAEVSKYYDVTVTAATGTPPTFTISAAPKSGTMMAGDGTLQLDEAGNKTPANKWEGR